MSEDSIESAAIDCINKIKAKSEELEEFKETTMAAIEGLSTRLKEISKKIEKLKDARSEISSKGTKRQGPATHNPKSTTGTRK